jgi:hypothetical protein
VENLDGNSEELPAMTTAAQNSEVEPAAEAEERNEDDEDGEDLDGNPEELPEMTTAGQDSEVEPAAEAEERNEDDKDGKDLPVTTRSGRVVQRPSRFLGVTKVSRSEWKEVACEEAIKAELKQLFKELKVLQVIRRAEITKSAKVLKLHMFLVKKYLADGSFEKVKVRLVADGRDQDANLYQNKSSPTVAIHSVFTVLGLAATKTWQIVVKIDVKGAFVQTPMKGEPTYMKLDPKVSRYVDLYSVVACR